MRILAFPLFLILSLPAMGAPQELVRVNQHVNSVMTFANEPGDTWTLGAIRGDCDDFALNKIHALRQEGIEGEIGVFFHPNGFWHAVAYVDGWVLDNLEDKPYQKPRSEFLWTGFLGKDGVYFNEYLGSDIFRGQLAKAVVNNLPEIIDGDTFRYNGETIRILDLDTPEMRGKCPSERLLARKAKDRLQALLVGQIRLQRRGKGRYGRTLAHVYANGVDVAQALITEGLGRPYNGGRRSWC